MKRARFTEEQNIGVLKEHAAGAKTADLARKHGVSEATLFRMWMVAVFVGHLRTCRSLQLIGQITLLS